MPTLRPYESPEAVRGLNTEPLTRGAQELGEAGRFAAREGSIRDQAFKQLGSYAQNTYNAVKKYNDTQAVIHGTSAIFDQETQMDQQWNTMLKDGSALDPAKRQQFQQHWQDQREQLISGMPMDVQSHFAELNGRLQEENFRRQTAELSNVSAEADIGAVTKSLSNAEAMAYGGGADGVRRSMMMIDSLRAGFKADPNLSAEAAGKLDNYIDNEAKARIVKSAALGLFDHDPTPDKSVAIQEIKKNFGPGSDLWTNEETYASLINSAKGAAALQQSVNNMQRTNDERVARANYNNGAIDLMLKPPTDQNGQFDPVAFGKSIQKLAGIQTPDGAHVMSQGEAREWKSYGEYLSTGTQRATTEGTFDALMSNMAKGQMPSREQVIGLMTSQTGPHLDRDAGVFLLNQVQKGAGSDAPQIAQAVKTGTSIIFSQVYPNGAPGTFTPAGDAATTAFKNWFYPALRQGLAEGKTLDELTDIKSPMSLINPERMKQFNRGDDTAVLKTATGTTQGAPQSASPKAPLVIKFGTPPTPGP